MSFCWECGTPLPNSFETAAKTEELPKNLYSSTPTIVAKNETSTVMANKTNLVSTPPPVKPSNSKLFLVFGGLGALLLLFVITIAGVVIYKLMPDPQPVVPLKPTPSVSPTSTPNISPTSTPRVSPTPTPKVTPEVSFTPPTEPTKQGTFTIYANNSWQLSDINTVANENFRTTVQGKIDLAGIKTGVSSNGVNDAKTKSRRIYQEFPTGALLMRTRYANGKFSNVVAVTANGANGTWLNYPDEQGKIEFCVNDNAPENNTGQFTITVTFTSISTPKKK